MKKSVINFLAYISIAFIAVALVVVKILGSFDAATTVAHAMELIAQVIAYTITAVFAFFYAKSRKNIGWLIAFIVFVVIIIIFLIIK